MANREYLAYRCLAAILLPAALLRLFWKSRRYPDARARWRERLGYFHPLAPAEKYIWIHAVSVGESTAAEPLIDELLKNFPDRKILMTTTTATGAENVKRRFGGDVEHSFFPYDLRFCLQRFFNAVQPELIILIETELWPNFLMESQQRKIPVMLINGRLSEKAAGRYARLPRLIKQMLKQLSVVAAQSKDDAARFVSSGANPENVVTTGSLKFDREINHSVFERGEALRRELGVNRFVFMAGSTREGEEEILLDAFEMAKDKTSGLLMIIAPRHPERFNVVADLLTKRAIPFCRQQDNRIVDATIKVFLLDVMGELTSYYAASDVAYVGGSLMPYGGHNTLEPAGLGVPIVSGPHTYNFDEINNKLRQAGALTTVDDAATLSDSIVQLNRDSNLRDSMGQAGQDVFCSNRGALSKVLSLIERQLASTEH